jgi:dethiobiotin synthetase
MPANKVLFVTGIGTEIGKTIVSAALVEKLQADYWKPIQSGDLHDSDSNKVQNLISNPKTRIFPEAYKLTQPFSPHKSAAIDGIAIEQGKIVPPQTNNMLIIEGAGGLMVPLNGDFMMIDLIKHLDTDVVLVSKNYLGSINHTLLSIYALRQYKIAIRGIIFNGPRDIYSKDYILQYTGVTYLGHIPEYKNIDKKTIIEAGSHITL